MTKKDDVKLISVRVPVELAAWLKERADKNCRPISLEVRKMIEDSKNAIHAS